MSAQLTKLMMFSEDDIADLVDNMPNLVTQVLGVEDLPITPEQKQRKAPLWRQEDDTHEALRTGIASAQSSLGPSYSPFGLLRFMAQAVLFLMICDFILP